MNHIAVREPDHVRELADAGFANLLVPVEFGDHLVKQRTPENIYTEGRFDS